MSSPTDITLTAESVTSITTGPARLSREERFTRITRWVIYVFVALIGILLLIRFWYLDGIIRTVRIVGPSMAPTLLGEHYDLTCDDCRYFFQVDAAGAQKAPRIVCPNCGYRDVKLDDSLRRDGDTVLLDRWPLLFRGINRGDVVGLTQPESGELAVKRVIALPGETWSIVDGDLLIQSQRAPTLIHTDALDRLVTVYDHNHPSRRITSSDRWLRPAQNNWEVSLGKLKYTGPTKPSSSSASAATPPATNQLPEHWLAYQQWTCWESPIPRTTVSETLDNDSYNPANSRTMQRVNDLFFRGHLTANGNGCFAIRLRDETKTLVVAIRPALQELLIYDGTKVVAEHRIQTRIDRGGQILAGLIDNRVLVAWNGRPIAEYSYREPIESKQKITDAVAVGAIDIEATLLDVRILRDNVLSPAIPTTGDDTPSVRLGAREIAVLGDNPAVSLDSRAWPPGSINESEVRGVVYRPFWAKPR